MQNAAQISLRKCLCVTAALAVAFAIDASGGGGLTTFMVGSLLGFRLFRAAIHYYKSDPESPLQTATRITFTVAAIVVYFGMLILILLSFIQWSIII